MLKIPKCMIIERLKVRNSITSNSFVQKYLKTSATKNNCTTSRSLNFDNFIIFLHINEHIKYPGERKVFSFYLHNRKTYIINQTFKVTFSVWLGFGQKEFWYYYFFFIILAICDCFSSWKLVVEILRHTIPVNPILTMLTLNDGIQLV